MRIITPCTAPPPPAALNALFNHPTLLNQWLHTHGMQPQEPLSTFLRRHASVLPEPGPTPAMSLSRPTFSPSTVHPPQLRHQTPRTEVSPSASTAFGEDISPSIVPTMPGYPPSMPAQILHRPPAIFQPPAAPPVAALAAQHAYAGRGHDVRRYHMPYLTSTTAAAPAAPAGPIHPPIAPTRNHGAAVSVAPIASATLVSCSSTQSAATTTVSSSSGVASAKRQPNLGKRKLAEVERRLQEGARTAAAQLRAPTTDELSWLDSLERSDDVSVHNGGSTQDDWSAQDVAFIWHFTDGSTSARPREPSERADLRTDPHRDAVPIGYSICLAGRASAGHTNATPPQEAPPSLPCGLTAVGCKPLALNTASSQPYPSQLATSTTSSSLATANAPDGMMHQRCVHWLLPSRLGRLPTATPSATPAVGAAPASAPEQRACELGWELIRGLLRGERRITLICPNAKLCLRTLKWIDEREETDEAPRGAERSSAMRHGGAGAASNANERRLAMGGGAAMWAALEWWADPLLIAWLLDPDSTEEQLRLERLLSAHLSTQQSQLGACSTAEGEHELGGGLDGELDAIIALTRALYARLQRLLPPATLHTVLRREMRVAEMLAGMEMRGLPFDPSALTRHINMVAGRLEVLRERAEALLRAPINLASAQQVSTALHVQLGLPRPKQTDAAQRATHGTTSEAHLKDLVRRCPECALPGLVLEHRELSKLASTFLQPLAGKAILPAEHGSRGSYGGDGDSGVPGSSSGGSVGSSSSAVAMSRGRGGTMGRMGGEGGPGRLYSTWLAHSTGTGRLSSRHPNVQQVPKGVTLLIQPSSVSAGVANAAGGGASTAATLPSPSSGVARMPIAAPPTVAPLSTATASVCVRDAFRAPEGFLLLSADYSQLEMRLLAHLSGDPALQTHLYARGGGDFFRSLAGAWHTKAPDAVTSVERGQTKQICYGILCVHARALALRTWRARLVV